MPHQSENFGDDAGLTLRDSWFDMTALRPSDSYSGTATESTVQWSAVSDTMWVGRRREQFVGIVESESPGSFTGFDSVGTRLQTHPDLFSAQRSIEPEVLAHTRRERAQNIIFIAAASFTAIIAGSLGLVAVLVGF